MSVEQLSLRTWGTLPATVQVPGYDPAALGVGIVHLGLGAFHRAHQAVYTDEAIACEGGDWGIVGVSLRSPGVRNELQPQDGLYTVGVREDDRETLRVIGALRRVLVAPEDPAAVIEQLTSPEVRVVTLTITEKGYCLNPASGRLDEQHAEIAHDCQHPNVPRSAVGLLGAAIARRAANGAPLTVVSCDNLAGNGVKLGAAIHRYLEITAPAALDWCQRNVSFPSTMVDRIVPAVTDADREHIRATLGLIDRGCVQTEPFSQWIIEDNFTGPRPAWECGGARFVDDLAPFEEMKLRLLNGPHSAIAYLGCLGGYATVAESMANGVFAAFIEKLMRNEILPEVSAPPGFDLADYVAALQRRFANSALAHRTAQIAMDGSQKLPQRLLPVIRSRLAQGRGIVCLATVIAAWVRYLAGSDLQGRPLEIHDPLAGRLRPLAGSGDDSALAARAVLSVREVFGEDLGEAPIFIDAVTAALRRLGTAGVEGAMSACLTP